MKTLLLMRHAKSSWSDASLADHERPLNARGHRAARKMGRRLAKKQPQPQLILSSPALRALRTGRIVARRLSYPRRHIIVQSALYQRPQRDLLRMIGGLQAQHSCVLLIGHNPQLTALAHRFSQRINHMPTGAVAILSFDTAAWNALGPDCLIRTRLECPRKPRA